jgi:hypothetical protein
MSDNITIVKQDNNVTVEQTVNEVIFSSVGAQGPKGTIIIKGTGAPSTDVGVIGDFYINSDTKEFYGPKTAQGWGNVDFLMGGNALLAGTTVPSPTIGTNGDVYINTTTNQLYKKVANSWGAGQVLVNPANFSYVFEKQSMATTWSIPHNLHYRPSVTVMDYGKNNIECDITHIDADNMELDFNSAVSGYAYLS